MQTLRHSGKVGQILVAALSGRDPAGALSAALVLDSLDAWVRLGFLNDSSEPEGAFSESEQNARLSRAAITDMFHLAASAMQSDVPGTAASMPD